VLKGTHNLTQKVYAIKIVDKKLLMREGKVNTAHAEKNSLTKLGVKAHPGVIKLHWTFQDDWSLCANFVAISLPSVIDLSCSLDFVLDLAPNGDLQTRIQKLGSLSCECTRYYMAQVVDALLWMHSKGVLHRCVYHPSFGAFRFLTDFRDLKPENVLLDSEMRVKITDFGTSKSFDEHNSCRHFPAKVVSQR
jgi:3-phosphoinositide dependent protein kinase-1